MGINCRQYTGLQVMGKNLVLLQGAAANLCPAYCLMPQVEKMWVQDDSWLLFKALMLITITVRLSNEPQGAPTAQVATHRCWSGTRWGGQTRDRKGCCPSCRWRSAGISAVGLVMASVCLLDLFAKYLQQAGAHFIVKKTDRNIPPQEAIEVNPKHSVRQCQNSKRIPWHSDPWWMEGKNVSMANKSWLNTEAAKFWA